MKNLGILKNIFALGLVVLTASACDPVLVENTLNYKMAGVDFTEQDMDKRTKIATARVDYGMEGLSGSSIRSYANAAVYFSFTPAKAGSPGVIQETAYDAWQIGIATAKNTDGTDNIYVVSNSGDFGISTRFYPFAQGKTVQNYIDENFRVDDIRHVSFLEDTLPHSPYQKDEATGQYVANPMHDALSTGKKYFLKKIDSAGNKTYYVIWFDKLAEPKIDDTYTFNWKMCDLGKVKTGAKKRIYTGEYVDIEVEDIASCSETKSFSDKIKAEHSFNYIWFYVDDNAIDISDEFPEKSEWDILFRRTQLFEPGMIGEHTDSDGIIGTSSILINSIGGIEVAPLYGWDYDQVLKVPQSHEFKKTMNAIGHGYANILERDNEKMRKSWYYALTMPPTFYLSRISYVVKLRDGKYGKFQPGTFYGPGHEKFFVTFRYTSDYE